MKIFSFTLSFLFLTAIAFGQSGWTLSKGKYFGKIDFTSFNADKYYTASGELFNTNTFSQKAFNVYGEYGLTDHLTVILNVPLIRINSFETTNKVSGIGDAKIELKYQLTNKSQIPISISIAPEIPLGRSNAFAVNASNPLEKINLPLGDGEFNVWTTLAFSLPFANWAYSSYFGAYNFRSSYEGKQFRNQYQIGFEIGVKPIDKLWLNTKLRGQYSNGNSLYPELSFIRGDGTTYSLISFEAFYKLKKQFGISMSYFTGSGILAPFKNIYIAPYFSVGFIYENK